MGHDFQSRKQSEGPAGQKIPTDRFTSSTGFVDKKLPSVQSTQSAYTPTLTGPAVWAASGQIRQNAPKKDNTPKFEDDYNYIPKTSAKLVDDYNYIPKKENTPRLVDDYNYTPKITIHNDNKGNTSTGNSTHPDKSDYQFKSIVTKNNTFLNTENDEVTDTWEKVQKLMKLNQGWTEIDAANFLNYGSTDRKYNGDRGKEKQAGFNAAASNAITGGKLINTWGMGIRGDYNFGKPMDIQSYSNGLDWAAASTNQLSNEDQKIQRAILDETKQFKKPSKFGNLFRDVSGTLNALIGIVDVLKPVTRETFETPVGSVGWDNLAIRQIKRGELMPDGSNPYDYLKKHENKDFKNLAEKYRINNENQLSPDNYKPMKWWSEKNLPQDEVDKLNAQLFEENLSGIETGYSSQGEELFRTIKTEMDNSNLDVIDNIRIDGDIVSLNEAFREGPDLMSNEKEITGSEISSSVYQVSEEDKDTEDVKEKFIAEKYIHPADRKGGFEALFGIPYSPHTDEPNDTRLYLEGKIFAGRDFRWNPSTGKYEGFDESQGMMYYTPEELRLELSI